MTTSFKRRTKDKFIWLTGSLIIVSLYIYLFVDFKIVVFNKTGYDLDSLEINGNFYQLKKGQSLSLTNCSHLSVQGDLPFVLPTAIVNGKHANDSKWDYCLVGVTEIKHGHHKYDLKLEQDSVSSLLYWADH